jgi:hypothetical protein
MSRRGVLPAYYSEGICRALQMLSVRGEVASVMEEVLDTVEVSSLQARWPKHGAFGDVSGAWLAGLVTCDGSRLPAV